MHLNSIIELLEIKDSKLKILDVKTDKATKTIHLMRERENHVCPKCRQVTNRVHDYRNRTIKHSILNTYNVYVIYRRRRYVCPSCNARFPEHNNFVEKHHKISHYTKQAILDEYQHKHSFHDIARKLNISASTVMRWSARHINPGRLTLPEVLSIDEFKNLKQGKGKYACLLANPLTREVVDVLEDRRLRTLEAYFATIPLEERKRVKVVSTDLYESYRRLVKRVFPCAKVVADKFHFIRQLYWGLNNVRVRVMKTVPKGSEAYYILKKHWKTLNKYTYALSYKHYYDYRFKYHITPREIVERACEIHPDMKKAIELKDSFYEALQGLYKHEAKPFFEQFIHKLKASKIPEYQHVAKTFTNWKDEILNAFPLIDETTGEILDNPPTNAAIEGMNNKIKTIKRISFGYRNFENFRRRIMTSFNGLKLKSA